MSAPSVVRSVAALRSQVRAWHGAGLRVGFVPTMGALHDGHLALVREALARCERAMVSIFVNPTQFAPHEDLSRYPRDEAGDLAKLASVGTHLAFLPTVAEMYPEGASTWVEVEGLSQGLCAERRPHHFRGMATVVTMLLNQAQADVAVFGEKDYQQLLIVRRLARDLAIPTEIVGGRTVREGDGLAMSSRNLPAHARTPAPRAHAAPRARGHGGGARGRQAGGAGAPARGREPARSPGFATSTMSSCATPRRWRHWRRSATGRRRVLGGGLSRAGPPHRQCPGDAVRSPEAPE